MKKVKFNPLYNILSPMVFTAKEHEIKNEIMLYGASWDFARDNCGALTRRVMAAIVDEVNDLIIDHSKFGYHPIIDTKSVMLMPGWYPCIPRWHCDGVIRKNGNSQPNIDTVHEPIYHFVSTIASDEKIPGSEFIDIPMEINVDEENVWKSVDEEINLQNSEYDNETKILKSGQIVKFQRQALHRCPVSKVKGWRYFFRLSFYHMPAINEIRNQVQVYTDPNQGW